MVKARFKAQNGCKYSIELFTEIHAQKSSSEKLLFDVFNRYKTRLPLSSNDHNIRGGILNNEIEEIQSHICLSCNTDIALFKDLWKSKSYLKLKNYRLDSGP